MQLINCTHPGTLPVDLACFLHRNTHILCRCDIKRKYHLCSRRINEKYRLYLMKMNEYHSCYALVVLIHFHQIRAVFFINSSWMVVFPILIWYDINNSWYWNKLLMLYASISKKIIKKPKAIASRSDFKIQPYLESIRVLSFYFVCVYVVCNPKITY